jgi:hypothetical protein
MIIGTGFLVSESGIVATNRHVAEPLQALPKHPRTGEDGFAALMFEIGNDPDGVPFIRWMLGDIASAGMLNSFSSTGRWFGEARPDIAFLQLKFRNTPHKITVLRSGPNLFIVVIKVHLRKECRPIVLQSTP